MSQRPCHFFKTRGGCRSGNNCRYSHDHSSQDNSPTSSPRGGRSPTPPGPRLPPGVCQWFWRGGNCNRGFQCRYRHDCPDGAGATNAPVVPDSTVTSSVSPSSLTQENDLSQLSNATTDPLFSTTTKSKSPSEVHNALKRFLFDKYQFRHVLDMYSFVSLLPEANSNNTSWVSFHVYLWLQTCSYDLSAQDLRRGTGEFSLSALVIS